MTRKILLLADLHSHGLKAVQVGFFGLVWFWVFFCLESVVVLN